MINNEWLNYKIIIDYTWTLKWFAKNPADNFNWYQNRCKFYADEYEVKP